MNIPAIILQALSNVESTLSTDEFLHFMERVEQKWEEDPEFNTPEAIQDYLECHTLYTIKSIEFLQENPTMTEETEKKFKLYIYNFCEEVLESLVKCDCGCRACNKCCE